MKIVLIGASLETTNLGVSALGYSVISGLVRRIENLELTLFDYGRSIKNKSIAIDGSEFKYKSVGCSFSKNVLRSDSIWNYYINALLRIKRNSGLRQLLDCDCVLDITGGDSFTDLYGRNRFMATYLRKRLVLKVKKPLILLPQTYGPFVQDDTRKKTRELLDGAHAIWTRDLNSKVVIEDLYGNDCKLEINLGMDVAFLLPRKEPKDAKELIEKLHHGSHTNVGINISGLLYEKKEQCFSFGITIDYDDLMVKFINWLNNETNSKVFLIPHVLGDPHDSGQTNSDIRACYRLKNKLKDSTNIYVIENSYNQSEIKWFISKMDWFSGARMHSTIAGVSSMVPTAVQAYSDKALGVFNVCGQENNVIDLRDDSFENIFQEMKDSFLRRKETKDVLEKDIPGLLSQGEHQMDELANIIMKSKNG